MSKTEGTPRIFDLVGGANAPDFANSQVPTSDLSGDQDLVDHEVPRPDGQGESLGLRTNLGEAEAEDKVTAPKEQVVEVIATPIRQAPPFSWKLSHGKFFPAETCSQVSEHF